MNGGPVCWTSRRQNTTALSSTETKYTGLAFAIREIMCLKQFLTNNKLVESPKTLKFLKQTILIYRDQFLCVSTDDKYLLRNRNECRPEIVYLLIIHDNPDSTCFRPNRVHDRHIFGARWNLNYIFTDCGRNFSAAGAFGLIFNAKRRLSHRLWGRRAPHQDQPWKVDTNPSAVDPNIWSTKAAGLLDNLTSIVSRYFAIPP